jgi:hypothetical protein
MTTTLKDELFSIPLPGGRVARVPLTLLEQYVDPSARISHNGYGCAEEEDVTAHSMSIEATTGSAQWHTEWELGQADYTDDTGFPQSAYVWHRHPLGTEYTEIYQR